MKTCCVFTVCLAAIMLLTSAATAAVIGSHTVSSGTVYTGGEHTFAANLRISTDPLWPQMTLFNGPDTEIFDRNGIDVFSNVGKTYWVASNQDDPEFSCVINQITDGQLDYLWITIDGTGLPIGMSRLVGRPNDFSVTDLHGYTIQRIGLTMSSASHSIDYNAIYPHVYSMTVTCTFEGVPAVPEPTSFVALIAGMSGLCAFKFRNRPLSVRKP